MNNFKIGDIVTFIPIEIMMSQQDTIDGNYEVYPYVPPAMQRDITTYKSGEVIELLGTKRVCVSFCNGCRWWFRTAWLVEECKTMVYEELEYV